MFNFINNALSVFRTPGVKKNAAANYATYAVNFIVPLAAIPYLIRVLGPNEWGSLAFFQSVGLIASMLVEFGFSLTVARQLVIVDACSVSRANLLAVIQISKLYLAVVTLLLVFIVSHIAPIFIASPELLYSAVFWGVLVAITPIWFFQSHKKLVTVTAIDVFFRLSGLFLVFYFVRTESDGYLYFVLIGGASLISTIVMMVIAFRGVEVRFPSLSETLLTIKNGFYGFTFRASISMHTVGNTLVLGFLVSPVIVGYFSVAERLIRAIMGAWGPFLRALYLKTNFNLASDSSDSVSLVKNSFFIYTFVAAFVALLVVILSEDIVGLVVGSESAKTVKVLCVLAMSLPLVAASDVLGIQWMMSKKLDFQLNVIMFIGGVVNVLLILAVANLWYEQGVAFVVVFSEFFILCMMWTYLNYRKLNPVTIKDIAADKGEF